MGLDALELHDVLVLLLSERLGHGVGKIPIGASLMDNTGGCELPENAR